MAYYNGPISQDPARFEHIFGGQARAVLYCRPTLRRNWAQRGISHDVCQQNSIFDRRLCVGLILGQLY